MGKLQRFIMTSIVCCFILGGWQSVADADIYRYETENGDILMTTEPRKGLKLLDVIKDSKKDSKKVASQSSPSASNAPKTTSKTQQTPVQTSPNAYESFIQEASKIYGIPVPFIKAVIKIESNFNPRAVSRTGAMGLMQLMPATAEHMKVKDPFDPRQNILGGTRYLRRLSDRYDGDINLILFGYHAGPGNVEQKRGVPFEETQQYIKNVYFWYLKYRDA